MKCCEYMSFRSKENLEENEWLKKGICLAFWNGHEKTDLSSRLIIVFLMTLNVIFTSISIIENFRADKIVIMIFLLVILIGVIPSRNNLTIIKISQLQIEFYHFKSYISYFRPKLRATKILSIKDIQSIKIDKKGILSPYHILQFQTTIFEAPKYNVYFRSNLPRNIHSFSYYNLDCKCYHKINKNIGAIQNFMPRIGLKNTFEYTEYRHILLMSLLIFCSMFTILITFFLS